MIENFIHTVKKNAYEKKFTSPFFYGYISIVLL